MDIIDVNATISVTLVTVRRRVGEGHTSFSGMGMYDSNLRTLIAIVWKGISTSCFKRPGIVSSGPFNLADLSIIVAQIVNASTPKHHRLYLAEHIHYLVSTMAAVILVTGGTGLVGKAIQHAIETEPEGSRFGKRPGEQWIYVNSSEADLRCVPTPSRVRFVRAHY